MLRDYQIKLKNDIYNGWAAGHRNVLAVLPTGGGKSVVLTDIIYDGVQQGLKQSVMAHRNELVSQLSGHLGSRGIKHKIIGSNTTIAQITRQHRSLFHGQSFVVPVSKTAVVGVDTLVSRRAGLADWAAQLDRWIGDEAHHFIGGGNSLNPNKWGKCVEMSPQAHGLGVTATPCRSDGQGLGWDFDGPFNHMVLGPTMRELINMGHLSDFEIVCPTSDLKVEDNKVGSTGDWASQSLKKASKESKIVGDTVKNYCKFAYGRRAIVFATDVETAGDIARNFLSVGIKAVSLSAETNPLIREKAISDFKNGNVTVLVNVDLFDEGFDVPACDVVIMARPTASLGKYRQMVGRALRPMPGKIALIIDQVSNIVRHGLPDKYIVWMLARADKRVKAIKDPEDIPITVCLNTTCLKVYEKFRICCPHCGTQKPLPQPRERTIEIVEGDLILLDRETLERMRRAMVFTETPEQIGERVARTAGAIAGKGVANRLSEKITIHQELTDTIAQWAAVERSKGFDDREIHKKFYMVTGMDVLSALDASRQKSEFESLTTMVRGWYEK